jgi:death on curing protein
MFPELLDKIAVLIHSIINFHPFADGNKRTALIAADVCLKLNGIRLKSTPDVEPFFWSIARGEQSIENIKDWLNNSVEKVEE